LKIHYNRFPTVIYAEPWGKQIITNLHFWGYTDSIQTSSSHTTCFLLSHLLGTRNCFLKIFFKTKLCIHFSLHTTTNKYTQQFHKLSHCYMFRHCRVILRQPVIITLPSYTGILCYEPKNAHNNFTNYHTATCFDTIVSSSGSV